MRLAVRAALAGLAVCAAVFAPLARSEDAQDASAEVVGWKVRTSAQGLVRLRLADLPGLAKSGIDAKSLVLTSRGETVFYFLNKESTELSFWGQPDAFSLDARGRCYRLRKAGEGEVPSLLGAREPIPAPSDEDAKKALRCAKFNVFPREKREFDQLESHDVPSLSKLGKEGGYWFHVGVTKGQGEPPVPGARLPLVLHFPTDGYEGEHRSSLHLRGVFAWAGDRKSTPGRTQLVVQNSATGFELAQEKLLQRWPEGDDLDVPIEKHALEAPEAGLALSSNVVPTRVFVQHAWLEYARPAILDEKTPALALTTAGPTRFQFPKGSEPVFADLTTGDLLAHKDGVVASDMNHATLGFLPEKVAVFSGKIEPSYRNDLRKDGQGADWLAIAPRALAAAVSPLAAHREKEGFKSKIAILEDIEDSFNDGTFGQEGIRSFLAYVKKSWKPAPRFVLLVGDAWRDGKPDDSPWLPTSIVDTYDNGGSASDYDLAPEGVAIGRFPARTPEEVRALVAKTIAYEKAPPSLGQKQLAFVTGEGHFGPMIDKMIEDLFARAVAKRVPDAFDVDVTYANPGSIFLYPPDDFTARVVERLSAGPLIFDYIGHGSQHNVDTVHWGAKRFPILRREDAEKVHCEEGRHPICLITACWTGAFDEGERTVGEALVLNPRGAVAVFAASRVSHPFANALLSLELTSRLFQKAGEVEPGERPRLGERLRGALDDLSLESGGAEGKTVRAFAGGMLTEAGLMERLVQDERHLYNLLGDPALAVRYPRSRKLASPGKCVAGSKVDVSLEGDARPSFSLTLERGRAPRADLEGLKDGTGPEALDDPKVRARILETYAKANDFILARATSADGKATLDVPADLAPGTYRLKVVAKDGSVGSALLAVEANAEAPPKPKKRYL